MTNDELNQYVLHYLKEDRTKSAIMLTAGWGTGKSYYIQNELIPFLSKAENGSYPCIIASLYGLKGVDEISKTMYLAARIKPLAKKSSRIGLLTKKSEGMTAGKIVVKTIAKNLFAGLDLSMSDADLQKLYQSIDLTGKLVILEDIERSEIDILDVLGYVYNLVEEDGVKVLLVANEDEILKYCDSKPDKDGNTHKVPDDKTVTYLKTKEKTVSDTISYSGEINVAISNIILSFNDEMLGRFATEDQINDIVTIMTFRQDFNLRSFLFACQKVSDVFNMLGTVEDDVARTIFFSVLTFSMQIKDGYFPNWEGTESISTKLGIGQFPLYRFCYDYIRWQEFDINKVQEALDAHKKLRLYDEHGEATPDDDLRIVFCYYEHSEEEVLTALKNVENRLDDSEDIPIYCYSKLAYCLVACYTILEFDYTACKRKMISNMHQHGKEIDSDLLFLSRFTFEDESERQQFANFSQALRDAVEVSIHTAFDFSYKPEDIHSLRAYTTKNRAKVTAGHAFIIKFALDKLVDMFFVCNPNQLHDWRGILFAVYRHSTKADFLETDRSFMEELIAQISNKLSEKKAGMDRIVLFQVDLLVKNLQMFIEQLS